ncbi:tyrosine-type recombinase/integrase [Thioalkalivibrio sp.]|uniref:tyrosine-type recombinase/integrase n=1 Tax=Thioalkalivibrio sp. TaxID=2093813 RepID=UPI0035683512
MTKRFRFTKKIIESLEHDPAAKAKETEFSDQECVGLKLVVTPKGRRFYYFRYTTNKRRRGMKIGEFPALSLPEARRLAYDLRAQVDRGEDPQAARDIRRAIPTLQEFVDEHYLPHAKATKRSAKDDESRLRHRVLPTLGRLPLDAIDKRTVQQLLAKVRTTHSAATHNRVVSLLHRVFALAIEWGFLPEGSRNPVTGIKKLPEAQRTRYLNRDELKRFLVALADQPNRRAAALLAICLLTGARIGEVRRMRYADLNLDPEAPSWHIPHTNAKSGKSRTVMLSAQAVEVLKALEPVEGNLYVFAGKKEGQPMVAPQKVFENVLEEAEINDFRVHDLRHTWASYAAMSGAPMRALQATLGHHALSMTQRYSHLSDETLRETSQSVANAIATATGR